MTKQEYFIEVDKASATLSCEAFGARLEELVNQALKEYGPDSDIYASMLSELGGFHRGQYRFKQALTYFRQAADILLRLDGTGPDYTTVLNNIAGTYRMSGNYGEAEALYHRCIDLYAQSLGTHHILYASALNNLGMTMLDKGDTGAALALFSQCSQILGEMPDRRDEYATSIINLGCYCLKAGRLTEARDYLLPAIEMFRRREINTITSHYHSALNTLGIVYEELGDNDAARAAYEEAADIARHLYNDTHREYIAIMQRLNNLKERTGM